MTQPRDDKCDIEPGLQKELKMITGASKLILYSTDNGSTTVLTTKVEVIVVLVLLDGYQMKELFFF